MLSAALGMAFLAVGAGAAYSFRATLAGHPRVKSDSLQTGVTLGIVLACVCGSMLLAHAFMNVVG